MITRHSVTLTSAADGSATGYIGPVTGFIHALRYVPHGSTPLDTNADVTITAEVTGAAILTITNIGTSALNLYPRAATASVANAAALYAATFPVNDRIPVCEERIKFVVAQGADTKTGTFYVYLES